MYWREGGWFCFLLVSIFEAKKIGRKVNETTKKLECQWFLGEENL